MNQIVKKEDMFIQNENGEMVVAPNAIEFIHDMEERKKKADKEYSKIKAMILEGMEEYGIKKVDTDDLLITYIEPTERCSIDTKKLWAEYKDVAFACEKVSQVKSSVRITVR